MAQLTVISFRNCWEICCFNINNHPFTFFYRPGGDSKKAPKNPAANNPSEVDPINEDDATTPAQGTYVSDLRYKHNLNLYCFPSLLIFSRSVSL